MRKDYSDGDNPISQLYRYADKIKLGKAMDKDGRPIRVSEATQFYLYALCGYNAHIEILSYDKMLSDSKKRNKILFDKLGF